LSEGLLDTIIYNKPTTCNSGSIVFIKNHKYALHVSDALCIHLQEHYKLVFVMSWFGINPVQKSRSVSTVLFHGQNVT